MMTTEEVIRLLFERLVASEEEGLLHKPNRFSIGRQQELLYLLVTISGQSNDHWVKAVRERLYP